MEQPKKVLKNFDLNKLDLNNIDFTNESEENKMEQHGLKRIEQATQIEQTRETLQKQLQLLSERSEKTDIDDLVNLSCAMTQIANLLLIHSN